MASLLILILGQGSYFGYLDNYFSIVMILFVLFGILGGLLFPSYLVCILKHNRQI